MELLAHFGFRCLPFTREIPVAQRLALPEAEEALTGLRRAVEQRSSAALIAPAGTGKTVLLRALADDLPEARYRCDYLKVTGLSKRDMCREIAHAIGAPPAGSYPSLVRRIQERFSHCLEADACRPVLLIDEAHDLRPEVLAMLRLITNFEMDSRLVVSLVLAGQPHLRDLLRRDQLQDLTRRLVLVATLRPLSREEARGYLEHRCNIAGAATCPFDPGAIEALYEVARGNLRATDQMALKALERAHDAGDQVVAPQHVIDARRLLCP